MLVHHVLLSRCFTLEVASLNLDCKWCVFESISLVVFVVSDGALMVYVVFSVAVVKSCWSVFLNCSCHSVHWFRWVIGFHGAGWSVIYDCVRISMVCHSPRGCWLCSTSLPGGHQVDGLPPAPSMRSLSLDKSQRVPGSCRCVCVQ